MNQLCSVKKYSQFKIYKMKNKLSNVLAAVILFLIPTINLGQSPDLGTASNFALFTAIGAFNNIGPTNVTGDVGTNMGEFNAFPSGTLVGQKHVVDATSADAAIDVESAYNQMIGIACDTVIGVTLGNNQVLIPKVYCLGGLSTLDGDLIIDGQNNPNALFIFKIDGAFATSTFARVILINSASWSNVYWQINGAFTLGDSSVFKGTILVNGAINLLQGSSLEGRALSRAGAINTYAITAKLSFSALPVGLLYFNGFNKDSYNLLSWFTATETNNNYFTLEKTNDTENFTEVSKIIGAGHSNTLLHYSAIDYTPYAGISYYRLKQTDYDGKFTYSNLVPIDFKKTFDFNIYPNPFSATTTITINEEELINKPSLTIYTAFGAEVLNTVLTKKITTVETNILPSGIYFYKLSENNKILKSGELISQQ